MTSKKGMSEEVFHQALDIKSPQDRAAYLDFVCDQNEALRQEVENLLRYHHQADSFLEIPAIDPQGHLNVSIMTEGPGTHIGPYKLLEKIGEGGMAVVYMAEQERPLRRKVALKLVKLGMDSAQVIARFDAERQALGLMDHPHIAKVFDAGTTDTGRPYFVMELVKGVSITHFCDRNQLSTQERLRLFSNVCQAVQHAHQKRIIHRDIKPSNIMVTLHNGKPMPKVIDFGIAKATDRRLTEKTLFTHYAQIIGTPEYMSPEQAELSDMDVDTRTDVYSLGVLLYELLTGRPPFEAAYLRAKSYAEIQRIIREEEPTRPSTKISALGEGVIEIADRRRTDPEALRNLMRTDLDWIVMKTLEKDRTRRYASVSEFAADIERHLNKEPVLAGPPSAWYRAKKYVQRHRTLITSLAAIGFTLLAGLCVSTYLLLRVNLAMHTVATLENQVESDQRMFNAQRLYAQGNYQAALTEIEPYAQSSVVDPKTRLLYARILFDLDRLSDAAAQLEPLVIDTELSIAGAAHYLLSHIKRNTDPFQAQTHQEQANRLMPETADDYVLRAFAVITPEEALQNLNEALHQDPGHYVARESRALIHYGLRNYQAMHQDAEALMVRRPKDFIGYTLHALSQRELGDLEEALSDYTRAIELCAIPQQLPVLLNQRQETYWRLGDVQSALADAQRCVALTPDIPDYAVTLGKILFELGRYEDAKSEFSRLGAKYWKQIVMVMMRYAFNSADVGELDAMPEDIKKSWPFFWLSHYAELRQALECKATRLVPSSLDISSWSPDSRQLAYTRSEFCGWDESTLRKLGPSGSAVARGIEILDLQSGQTRVLTTWGGGPTWSPDGKSIAFVKAQGLAAEEDAEIWIVPSAGGHPEQRAVGGSPGWTKHPTRLYYHSRQDQAVYYIDVADTNSTPVYVAPCPGLYPHVSPDERYLAYAQYGKLKVIELATGEEIVHWDVPGPEPYCLVRWSPNGREISLSALGRMHRCSGLWVFDVEQRQGWHLFDAEVAQCNWSPDRSKVALDVFFPVSEIWLTDIDPNRPTWESLAPLQTRHEYLQSHWSKYLSATTFTRLGPMKKREVIADLRDVGAHQYACGEFEEAEWTLQQVERAWCVYGFDPDVETSAYLAMVLQDLGRTDKALAALKKLADTFQHSVNPAATYSLIDQVFKLFSRDTVSPNAIWDLLREGQVEEALKKLSARKTNSNEMNSPLREMTGIIRTALTKAFFHQGKTAHYRDGDYGQAIHGYELAHQADPNFVAGLRELAWLHATCPEPSYRDGTKAVDAATRACTLTDWQDYRCLGILAAAYAEAGTFADAIKWQEKTLKALPEGVDGAYRRDMEERLKGYQQNQHYHGDRASPLVAWWPLDDNDGDECVLDSSGNAHHGSLVGDTLWKPTAGRFAGALELRADRCGVEIAPKPELNLSEALTVSAWVNTSAPPIAHRRIVTKGVWAGTWALVTDKTGQRASFVLGRRVTGVTHNTKVNTGQWHHVCATYDGTIMQLYVDGDADPNASALAEDSITHTKKPLCIGWSPTLPDRNWHGLIDDVRIYSRALNRAEVRALSAGLDPLVTVPPVAYQLISP